MIPFDPVMPTTTTAPDGRTLAYCEWGDPDGVPVTFLEWLDKSGTTA